MGLFLCDHIVGLRYEAASPTYKLYFAAKDAKYANVKAFFFTLRLSRYLRQIFLIFCLYFFVMESDFC